MSRRNGRSASSDPGQFGLDPERQAIGPDRPVDRDRAQRGERNACAGDWTERGIEILDQPEEHERAIAPHQRQSPLAVAAQPGLEARERHVAFGDLSRFDQDPSDRRVGQAVAPVIGEAGAPAIGKLDLRRALNLNEEGLDRVANPNDRVAALRLDRGPVVVRDERSVAEAPGAAHALGKSGGRGVETKRHKIGRPPQDRPAKRLGFERSKPGCRVRNSRSEILRHPRE